MTLGLDNYLGGRYQACALNYNHYLKQLLGAKFGIDDDLRYTIQFAKFTEDQMEDLSEADLPDRVREYIADFDGNMEPDDFNDERYSYRLLFTKKLVNHPGQADRVVEFIKPDSDLAKTISQEYWVRKEVEKPKFLPKQIVSDMREAGFPRFNMASHVALWQSKDAKDRSKGYGTMVAGHWYWYERWRDVVRAHCEESGDLYRVKE
jgi:hypothetical protein